MPDLAMSCLVHAPESLLLVPIIPYCRRTRNMRKRRNPIVKPTFAEALDLLAHAEVHARFEPHKSNLCKRSFLNETTIKEHVQQLTETSCVLWNARLLQVWQIVPQQGTPQAAHGFTPEQNRTMRDLLRGVSLRLQSHEQPIAHQIAPVHECGKTFGSHSSQQIILKIHSDSAGRNSPTEEHCKSCEHNAKLTYNDLNLDKFPAGTDRRLSTSTSVPAARRLIGMFTVWMKA
ncbi:zinc finger protein 358 [Culex quinquefasciatus]|uniref:Zinc finger protein 358 n=1 Tax=Culex quinquefasciatus TaxID=7176 RepID=B0WX20_CULQU|nr:zinc finger protein 358 [Culex quinquefasciatus]|eukprot:XP_001861942.1 zinc finger protein 358 [Culex quinquefasciatus]